MDFCIDYPSVGRGFAPASDGRNFSANTLALIGAIGQSPIMVRRKIISRARRGVVLSLFHFLTEDRYKLSRHRRLRWCSTQAREINPTLYSNRDD